jgi:hypothetical protein
MSGPVPSLFSSKQMHFLKNKPVSGNPSNRLGPSRNQNEPALTQKIQLYSILEIFHSKNI